MIQTSGWVGINKMIFGFKMRKSIADNSNRWGWWEATAPDGAGGGGAGEALQITQTGGSLWGSRWVGNEKDHCR